MYINFQKHRYFHCENRCKKKWMFQISMYRYIENRCLKIFAHPYSISRENGSRSRRKQVRSAHPHAGPRLERYTLAPTGVLRGQPSMTIAITCLFIRSSAK